MSKLRGHEIELLNGVYVYSDTKESTACQYKNRPCGYCGKHYTKEGHDGCLGTLENVMNACCGHGEVNDTYIQFNNKTIIKGKEAIIKLEELTFKRKP